MNTSAHINSGGTGGEQDIETIRRILDAADIAIVTTRSDDQHLYSRPMGIVKNDFTGTLWFFTEDPSAKTDEVRYDPEVNVSVGDKAGYLSMSGIATVVRDAETIDRHWSKQAEAWFEQGREDPKVAMLRVTVSTVEYWSIDAPAPKRLLEFAKALVTGSRPDVGHSETVEVATSNGSRDR